MSGQPVAPWLILAVGNASRGDDALGPALLERLSQAGVETSGEVELLTDFQLQVEHALDLEGRRAVLFVDAARAGAAHGVVLTPIQADDTRLQPASHALQANAVLRVALQLAGTAPPAWQLAIEGQSFDLGDDLSPLAQRNLDQAVDVAMEWLQTQGFAALA